MNKKMQKAFGLNEFEEIDFPWKISNTKIARLDIGNQMGCIWCFPHGYETLNSTFSKNRRNWKYHRRTQYK